METPILCNLGPSSGHDDVERLLMRTYIAGPMTGIKDFNKPAFNAKADELRSKGVNVCNPAEKGLPETADWSEHMRVDIRELTKCTHIYMLDGWKNSRGARLEHYIAQELGMVVIYEVQP